MSETVLQDDERLVQIAGSRRLLLRSAPAATHLEPLRLVQPASRMANTLMIRRQMLPEIL